MNGGSELRKLARLERKADRLRRKLKVSRPGELLFRAPKSMWSENDVVVEALGDGTARLLVVDGNCYPVDYVIQYERIFATEEEACDAADELVVSTI